MAYNANALVRLSHLKNLAAKTKATTDALDTRVTALENVGAQANA